MSEASSKRVEIIPAKRRALILEYLRANGTASIGELTNAVGGSQSTIRRDLEQLTDGGYLERTHGGALLASPPRATFEREPTLNAHFRHVQKAAIGHVAATRLRDGESVIFDSSSTVLEAVRVATLRRLRLTVVTNDLEIARIGSSIADWRVIVTGGTIRPGSNILLGEPGASFFETIHADLCFIGAYAVTGSLLTDATMEVAAIKRAMIRSARRSVLLVDSSKFQAPAFCTFATLAEIGEVITDEGVSGDVAATLGAAGTALTIAPAVRE